MTTFEGRQLFDLIKRVEKLEKTIIVENNNFTIEEKEYINEVLERVFRGYLPLEYRGHLHISIMKKLKLK